MTRGRRWYTPHHPLTRHSPRKTKPLEYYLLHPQDSRSQPFRFEMNRRDPVQAAPADHHPHQLPQYIWTLPLPQRKCRSAKKETKKISVAVGNYINGRLNLKLKQSPHLWCLVCQTFSKSFKILRCSMASCKLFQGLDI